jgi:CubicO group peptidase (beta-lactamase class C family)
MASATKLIASIALLQCVDKGLIGLDEPLTKILPELDNKEILKESSETKVVSQTKITARHLLSHTSGLGYWFLHPLLIEWSKKPEAQKRKEAHNIAERYNAPLIFEPGEGWAYGVSADWAGVVVRRLHNNISLEDYLIENVWKKVGLSAPFPTFHLSAHPEYKTQLMKAATRKPDGTLAPHEIWQGDDPYDQPGGHGLCATAKDYLAVLSDLVSPSPKLLSSNTISLMFTPQLKLNTPPTEMLLQLRPAWDIVAGPVPGEGVNHGLGGLLLLDEAKEIGQPKNLLAWGGGSNTLWWACREKGVAGFFGTQLDPFGDAGVKELANAWRKDFWSGFSGTS